METLYILKNFIDKAKIDHKENILKKSTLKDAFIYCIKNNLSSQKYGCLIEHYIIKKYNFYKNNSKDCNGDFCKNSINYELKVSIMIDKANFVQIRLHHECQYYIFIVYHINNDNLTTYGDIYVFKIPKENMIRLVNKYLSYAHGSKKKTITNETIEYALRPKFNSKLWYELLEFQIHENDFS